MTHRDWMDMAPEELRARSAVRRLPPVDADPDFRERLLAQFLGQEPPSKTRSLVSQGPRIRPWAWAAAPIAAALVLAVLYFATLHAPEWSLRAAENAGAIIAEGREIPLSDSRAVLAALESGTAVVAPRAAGFELVRGDQLVMAVGPGARVRLTDSRRARIGFEVVEGELNMLTQAGFAGRELIVRTREARVEISGTLVSVARDGSGTCVCVLEGTAMVGPNANAMEPVQPGKRMVLPRQGDPYITDVAPPHAEGLRKFVAGHRDSTAAPDAAPSGN
jgi:ferric-dicitrate binding protein FerR (iron transport regulator)